MSEEILTYDEFISMASQNKIQLIDKLAAKMLHAGYLAAGASVEYYRIKIKKDEPNLLAEATARRALLEGEYDALKHAVSALQSTLMAERELDK